MKLSRTGSCRVWSSLVPCLCTVRQKALKFQIFTQGHAPPPQGSGINRPPPRIILVSDSTNSESLVGHAQGTFFYFGPFIASQIWLCARVRSFFLRSFCVTCRKFCGEGSFVKDPAAGNVSRSSRRTGADPRGGARHHRRRPRHEQAAPRHARHRALPAAHELHPDARHGVALRHGLLLHPARRRHRPLRTRVRCDTKRLFSSTMDEAARTPELSPLLHSN